MRSGGASENGRRSPEGLEPGFEEEGALGAIGTLEWIGAGKGLEQLVPGLWSRRLGLLMDKKENPSAGDAVFPVAVGEDAVMSDLDKARGQDVLEEAADEFEGRQDHGAGSGGIARVAVPEGDVVFSDGLDAVVGDGHTVGVPPDVINHVPGSCERLSAVDIPLLVIEGCQEGFPGGVWVGLDVTSVDSNLECVEEFAPEERGENVDVNEEPRAGREPVFVVGREATAGDNTVEVGMIGQGL